MDQIFLLTLFFIFATTFASTFVGRLVRDRCLRDFHGFDVTCEMRSGNGFWGRLRTYANSLEIVFEAPHETADGHVETSTIFLKDRIPEIRLVYRYHDELSEANKARREADIESNHHPALHQQLLRSTRNFTNTFRDAISESIGFVISRAKQAGTSRVITTQDTRITKFGQTVVEGAVPRQAFEPILERYIGRRVVVEETRPDLPSVEHTGILKDYTADWIELLDCQFRRKYAFELSEPEQLKLNQNLDFLICKGEQRGDLTIIVENYGQRPVWIVGIDGEGYRHDAGQRLVPGASAQFDLTAIPPEIMSKEMYDRLPDEVLLRAESRRHQNKVPADIPGDGRSPANSDSSIEDLEVSADLPPLSVAIRTTRIGDLCLPRSHAYIKHGAEDIGRFWLLENWEEFSTWSRAHPARATFNLLWTAVNTVMGALVSWTFFTWIWNFGPGVLILSLVGGMLCTALWLSEWSAKIRNKQFFLRKIRRRLRLLSTLMFLYLIFYLFVLN